MAKKKKTAAVQTVIVLDNGERYPVTGETGRYYECRGIWVRKSRVVAVETAEETAEEPKEDEAEEVPEE